MRCRIAYGESRADWRVVEGEVFLARLNFAASSPRLDPEADARLQTAVQAFVDDDYARRLVVVGIARGPIEEALVSARLRAIQQRLEQLGVLDWMIRTRTAPPDDASAADTVAVLMDCQAM